jgi:P-type Ca2+ transporter type 2C
VTNRGLSASEASQLLIEFGPNSLDEDRRRSGFALIFSVLREPMLLLLLTAGVLSFLLADLTDAILLMATVVIVVGISLYQQQRTNNALAALRDLTAPMARVIRDGTEIRISSHDVVPGDILLLAEGDRVVADSKLISKSSLEFDESLLTGESIPVAKSLGEVAFTGSLVVRGHGEAKVIATGAQTELGKIGKSIESIPYQRTHLQESIDRIVKTIGVIALLTVVAILLIYGSTRGDWLEGGIAAIAAAMALIPEEFPVILTLFMALGAWRMAKVKVIARQAPAIEALGSVTVLCVDKTGTLTRNEMTLSEAQIGDEILAHDHILTDERFERLVRIASLAAPITPFDPMDRAFRALSPLEKASQGLTSLRELPVTKERMAYIHYWQQGGSLLIAAKGAPEHIAALCNVNEDQLKLLNERVAAAGQRGLRVLAVAVAVGESLNSHLQPEELDFEILGLTFLKDPIRDGVPQSVAECVTAGIRAIMITGDHPTTARAIANEIGLNHPDHVMTGREIAELTDQELTKEVCDCQVFARVTPNDKLRLIRALQSNGEVVSMTGDGINDAPALRAADIGIAMGQRGTDVAREAAHLIITDDNFTSIVAGIRRGRAIYANIQKAMTYVIAIHIPIFGMALVPVLVADWPLILVPALIAFHEVIIDPASSIAFEVESPDPKIMEQPPREPRSGVFDRRGISLAIMQGLSVFALVFTIFLTNIDGEESDSRVRSLTFAALVIANVLLILANRSRTLTLWETLVRRKNPAIKWLFLGATALLLLLLNVPLLSNAFDLIALSMNDYAMLILLSYLSISWFDILKIITRRKAGH